MHRSFQRLASRLAGLALGALLLGQTSCKSLAYVAQAAAGQDDLNRRARDIDMLVREEHVDARMRRLLSQVAVVKQFGERNGLKPTTNYTKYVRVDRPAVVWVVSASDPLRFHSKTWTFPFVGSFTYLGWFKLDEAKAFADELRATGLDVDVRGAGAYSTSGYFEDAVLSTMIPKGKEALGELANTILHESSHATIFVRHQSTLNESIANFVGDKLAERYVAESLGPDAEETIAYLKWERTGEARGHALRDAYATLKALYASSKPDAEKLAEKRELITRLRAQTGFRRPINNATLLQYKTYNSGQDEMMELLLACDAHWPKFIRALKSLEEAKFEKDQESDIGKVIAPLIAAKCESTDPP